MKAETIEKVIAGWKGFMMSHSVDINRTLTTERTALAELAELKCLVSEYQSPETHRLIELGKVVEKAFERGHITVPNMATDSWEYGNDYVVRNAKSLLAWYREQEGNNGKVD